MQLLEEIQDISGVTSNSNEVKKNYVFVAIKGNKFDGHDYIDQAIKNGAIYVVGEANLKKKNYIRVDNSRKALAIIARNFYKEQPDNIIAVTGTNGKSSIVSFFRQIAEYSGNKAASIGTNGVVGFDAQSSLTTPDSTTLFRILREAKNQGVKYISIEASSHGLKLNRMDGIRIKAAGFTNLSHDHLDFHIDMEDYLNAKMYLFTDILIDGVAILNSDIKEYNKISEICKAHNHKIISYGRNSSNIKLCDIILEKNRTKFLYDIGNNSYQATVNLVGEFQIYNILCAIGFAIACGIDEKSIVEAVQHIDFVEGRMEKVDLENKDIYVDYAHTPDALENALKALKPYCKNKLIVLFGCGGDRDKSKRALMGKIASENADIVIVTDDNPRTEDASVIRKEVLSACQNAYEVANRELGIKFAISKMQTGDILLIAGKGHEDYQIIGTEKIHFSDKEISKKYA